jgi:hypothetical protein
LRIIPIVFGVKDQCHRGHKFKSVPSFETSQFVSGSTSSNLNSVENPFQMCFDGRPSNTFSPLICKSFIHCHRLHTLSHSYCGIIIFRDGLIFAYFALGKVREIKPRRNQTIEYLILLVNYNSAKLYLRENVIYAFYAKFDPREIK